MESNMTDPYFMASIDSQILAAGRLEIPPFFLKKNRRYLQKYVCLEVATGKIWKVVLRTDGGKVWFDGGWQAFVENCSIKAGYNLVFRYQGGLFQVIIFDTKEEEIKYPADLPQVVKVEESDDSSCMILDEWPSQNAPQTSTVNLPNNGDGDNEVMQGEGFASSSARDRVLQKARSFQSSNDHFVVIMPPICDSHLEISGSNERFFNGGDGKGMFVNGPDAQAWYMEYRKEGSPLQKVIIYEGWGKFAEKYRLQDGDACIFELFMPNGPVTAFNVTIFHVAEPEEEEEEEREVEVEAEAEAEGEEVNINDAVETLEGDQQTGMRGNSDYVVHGRAEPLPSFAVQIGKRHLFRALDVPSDHVSSYLLDQHQKEVVLHGLDGKTWRVMCYLRARFRRLQSGWKDFALDNDLQVGDICVFELLSQAPNHYNVTIRRNCSLITQK